MCVGFGSVGRVETFIACTACNARKVRKTCAAISPQNCVKIVRAQLLHNFYAKNEAHAQFLHNFSEPSRTQKNWSVLRTISTQFFQPDAIFLRICGCTGQRCLKGKGSKEGLCVCVSETEVPIPSFEEGPS